ncbi:hypothetical protein B0H17DRAFT_465634 [Mycena rosella]|uniref:Uncharacterized protein n=1 Tax=Mycena rosella TaxID=1033263 RepID=A0AAD7GL88_MYCRO|nr:hypothetical protein B0H17DRAFT_465634 [Mycena rosella]
MHLQSLFVGTADQFTLVIFGSQISPRLTIPHLSTLTDAQRAVLLPTLDIPYHLLELTIAEGCNFRLADVMDCVQRHHRLTVLSFKSRSLSPGSVVDLPPNSPGRLHHLSAPATYIPSLLQAEPNIRHSSVTFDENRSNHEPFDLPTCLRALNAIASLPGSQLISLSLAFTRASVTECVLPWHVQALSRPIPHLTRLTLSTDGAPRAAVDISRLAPWLSACFPSLNSISIPDVCEDSEVEDALREARQNNV